MNFRYEPHKIKTRELLAAQGNLEGMINLMAKFAIDESGASIPAETARDTMLDMDLEDVVQAQNDFLPVIALLSKSVGL